MKTLLSFLTSFALSNSSLASMGPSALNCDFYQQIEDEMQCGPQAYFQRWAGPMCEKYLQSESNLFQSLFLSSELKAWFPQVRLCLQEELALRFPDLMCKNLDQHAKLSHIECYVQTGYCELSAYSKLQLAGLSANAVLLDPNLWQHSIFEISQACAELDYQR
ncbi:MAG: hypothetical protein ACXWC9_07285 [Pseudobdellovibrionaceae bacterium]